MAGSMCAQPWCHSPRPPPPVYGRDRAVFAHLSPRRAWPEHRLARLGSGWELPWRSTHTSYRTWGPLPVPIPSLCHCWAPRGHVQTRHRTQLDTALVQTQVVFSVRAGGPQLICPGCRWHSHATAHGTAQAQPMAQPCSARRASLVPGPQARDVPQRRKGSHSIHPSAVAVMCHLCPGAGDAQLQGRLPQLPAPAPPLPRPLWAHWQCRVSQAPGSQACSQLAPRAVDRAGAGLLSPRTLSLRAQTQRYLSRMRKSITMRTMGRKMRSRLSISAASSRASSRR